MNLIIIFYLIYHFKYKRTIQIYFAVPADGVKGKTWGPSTAGGSAKVRPNIVDESGQNRFSKSASSLEKPPRTLSVVPSVTSVPESG